MRRTVKVFVVPSGKAPEPGFDVEVESRGEDGLRTAARELLVERGYRVRTVSFTPTGLVAYVEPQ